MKKRLIIGNWKCNPSTLKEAKRLFLTILKKIKKKKTIEVGICPPFVYLYPLSNLDRKKKIVLGAQDVFFEIGGPFTGQISPKMLKDLGCKYVIIGHSEKRKFGEDDQLINKKIQISLKSKLIPIFCLGETLEEKEKGKNFERVSIQIQEGLKGITKKEIEKIVFAYEPVWSIGTGLACQIDDVFSMTIFIRKILSQKFHIKNSQNVYILYGGSVDSQNAKRYIEDAKVDGLLVGGSSLKPEEFLEIIHSLY